MSESQLIIVRIGEIALKGLNRGKFEQQLMNNIRRRIRHLGQFTLYQRESRIYVEPAASDFPAAEVLHEIRDIFGLVSASLVSRYPKDPENLKEAVLAYAAKVLRPTSTCSFKFECKRADKNFPLHSYDLCCQMGEWLLEAYPETHVEVHDPDYCFHLEIRDAFYLYHDAVPARKGLPVGMSGKGLLLLSGGIDSPVAGYLMASRGMRLEAIYFHTFPYTSEEAKQKVIDLAQILTRYTGSLKLHVVDFTAIQLKLNEQVPEELGTVVMRRMMMRIADQLAEQRGIKCLITGESLGQVASQTLEALMTTDCISSRPVFRPLIGLDKDWTTALARDIGTFETSILPYEDCCTVFVAKHPKTHPALADVEAGEAGLNFADLTAAGLAAIQTIDLKDCQN